MKNELQSILSNFGVHPVIGRPSLAREEHLWNTISEFSNVTLTKIGEVSAPVIQDSETIVSLLLHVALPSRV